MIPSLQVRVRLALDRFDLDVDFDTNRQVTGIFGASGSGKSSLLETIAGLRRNAVGRISFGDSTWLDSDSGTFLRPEGRNIGYVPQDGLLFPHRNVEWNLRSGTHRVARSDDPVA